MLLAVLAASFPSLADAACIDANTDLPESATKLGPGISAVVPHPILGYTIVANGSTLFTYANDDLENGVVDLYDNQGAGNIVDTPTLVLLTGGVDYAVFISRDDGTVERVDISSNGTLSSAWGGIDLSHPECINASLSAAPTVHQRDYASDAFRAKFSRDVVYVPTHYDSACANGNSENRVYALNAEDGSSVWTEAFNGSAYVEMDAASRAGYLDIENDLLYVGTGSGGGSQDSLWAIDVLTGTRAWSTNIGAIRTTPLMKDDKLYIATYFSGVHAVYKADGAPSWSLGAVDAYTLTPFIELRPNAYEGNLFVTGLTGKVYQVTENGDEGAYGWSKAPAPGVKATSSPIVDPDSGNLYVGADDGNIYQMDLPTGTGGWTRDVAKAVSSVIDIRFFPINTNDSPSTFEDIRMMAGAANGNLARFCNPWTGSSEPPIFEDGFE
jgi:outer membrane protein assembly factor BamB